MDEQAIQEFWQRHLVATDRSGGLRTFRGDYEAFFSAYDAYRSPLLPRRDRQTGSGASMTRRRSSSNPAASNQRTWAIRW